METILIFMAGWISTLSGVALGGWLVYRTKRDPYDPLFSRGSKGVSFNIGDDLDQEEQSNVDLPQPVASANGAFMTQFAERLAK